MPLKSMIILILIITLASCGMMNRSSRSGITNGYYYEKADNKKRKVYINIVNDTIRSYQVSKSSSNSKMDSLHSNNQYPDKIYGTGKAGNTILSKQSLDIDFLTIPLKYRPSQQQVPVQLNTNLNGALYLGFRTDKFKIQYDLNPLKLDTRIMNHYGFSAGIFTGIGNTAMTPTNTFNKINIEYDGIVWSKGIAGIAAINNFTVGLAFGFDNLLDRNRSVWIYEMKPWYGLAFGLNIN